MHPGDNLMVRGASEHEGAVDGNHDIGVPRAADLWRTVGVSAVEPNRQATVGGQAEGRGNPTYEQAVAANYDARPLCQESRLQKRLVTAKASLLGGALLGRPRRQRIT